MMFLFVFLKLQCTDILLMYIVFLKKGETKRVTIKLGEEAFRMYDIRQHKFVVEPGSFKVLVGASSADIRLTTELEVK